MCIRDRDCGRRLTYDMSNAIHNKPDYEFSSSVLPRRLSAFGSDAVDFFAQRLQKIKKPGIMLRNSFGTSALPFECIQILTQKILVRTILAFVSVV